jgi:hypothetical protein
MQAGEIICTRTVVVTKISSRVDIAATIGCNGDSPYAAVKSGEAGVESGVDRAIVIQAGNARAGTSRDIDIEIADTIGCRGNTSCAPSGTGTESRVDRAVVV